MKKAFAVIFAVAVLLCSCGGVYRYTEHNFFAMDTYITVTASENAGFNELEKITNDIENLLSRTKNKSEIYSINERCGEFVEISAETESLIEKAVEISKNTNGAFSPCMGALSDKWDITGGTKKVPSKQEIDKLLDGVSYENVRFDGNGRVMIENGGKIDLGGIAKGYALEKAKRFLEESGEQNFCISFGGNVAVMGSSEGNLKNNKTGWNVGIANPFNKDEILGTLLLENAIVSVSGSYERYFEKDGKIYHHIFDPKTGYPSDSGLASAVVVTSDGALADALSTALFVMGKDEAIEFYNKKIYNFEMLLVCEDGNVYISKGLEGKFRPNDNACGVNGNKLQLKNV